MARTQHDRIRTDEGADRRVIKPCAIVHQASAILLLSGEAMVGRDGTGVSL